MNSTWLVGSKCNRRVDKWDLQKRNRFLKISNVQRNRCEENKKKVRAREIPKKKEEKNRMEKEEK